MDALGKFGEHSRSSPNFPRASITRYTHAKHEQILNPLGNRKNLVSIRYHQYLDKLLASVVCVFCWRNMLTRKKQRKMHGGSPKLSLSNLLLGLTEQRRPPDSLRLY